MKLESKVLSLKQSLSKVSTDFQSQVTISIYCHSYNIKITQENDYKSEIRLKMLLRIELYILFIKFFIHC